MTSLLLMNRLALAVALALPNFAAADTATPRRFNIPPQALADAVNDFATTTDWQIGFPARLAKDIRTAGVTGRYTPQEALRKLLDGTGLGYRQTSPGTVRLERAAAAPLKMAAVTDIPHDVELPTVTVQGKIDAEPAALQSPPRYAVTEATTATKFDAPLLDVPQSITVIPRKLIEDRQMLRLNEAGETVSGVTIQPGYGGLSSTGFFMRGFSLSAESLRNGFRDFGFLSPREVANTERLEFLKGPASVLYGGNALGFGGVVNTVTKKPLTSPRYQASMTFGSFDLYRPSFDITGPVAKDIPLYYRLNFAYETANNFRDHVDGERVFVAPAFTWEISPQTKFTLELDHQQDDYVHDLGIPYEPEFLKLPIERFLGVPGFNRANIEGNSITYNLEHKFDENWRFRQGFNANFADGIVNTTYYYGGFVPGSRRLLTREANRSFEHQNNFAVQNELYGKFATGPIQHNFMVGAELARYQFKYDFLAAAVAPIDILNPDYSLGVGTLSPSYSGGYGSDNFALYTQDLMTLLPQLKLLFGGRYDWNDFQAQADKVVTSEKGSDHFSPRVGLVYEPFAATSLYFSWGTSFNPNFNTFLKPKDGQEFKPQTSEQFEFGIKQEFLDKRAFATLAFYHLTRQNLLTRDLSDTNASDGIDQIQTGERRSQGIEFDFAGELLPGWNLTAAYAYTDALVSKDTSGLQGQTLVNAPPHSANIWTTYEIQTGMFQGLGIGGGVFYQDRRETTLPNTLTLSGYVRGDASVFYHWKNVKLAVNIKNFTDTKLYYPTGDFLLTGAPMTVLGTVSVTY